MMKNVPTLLTIADPIFDNILVAAPEFGSFLLAQGYPANSPYMISFAQAQIIFDPSTESYNTLLNPDNMRAFFK